MANLVKLANGGQNAGVWYAHAQANPDEDTRDIILGGNGNDVILGDDETWADYSNYGQIDPWLRSTPPVFYWVDGYEGGPTEQDIEDYSLLGGTIADLQSAMGYSEDNAEPHFNNLDASESYDFDEIILGGGGNDTIFGFGGNDWLLGNSGNDRLYGGSGHDLVEGGSGDDWIDISSAHANGDWDLFDAALGGKGNDTITVDPADFADGGAGFDTLIVKNHNDQAFSFDLQQEWNGNSLTRNFEVLNYYGGTQDDVVAGGSEADKIYGGDGNDVLDGRGGNDTIEGGVGLDFLTGGEGADTLRGGANTDVINDDAGDDTVFGDDGDDIIWTGQGNDTIHGGAGDDFIGEAGIDSDVNKRTNANDVIYGDGGNDKIFGGTGKDIIDGGADNDLIVGGLSADELRGGGGTDTFAFRFEDLTEVKHSDGSTNLYSFDKIMDLSVKDHDMIDFSELKSHVAGNKLFFDQNDGAGPGQITFGELHGNVVVTVDLDGISGAEFAIELVGITYANTSTYALEQLILI